MLYLHQMWMRKEGHGTLASNVLVEIDLVHAALYVVVELLDGDHGAEILGSQHAAERPLLSRPSAHTHTHTHVLPCGARPRSLRCAVFSRGNTHTTDFIEELEVLELDLARELDVRNPFVIASHPCAVAAPRRSTSARR